MKKIIILGTGGNSVDILDTLNDLNVHHQSLRYQCLGFLDDDAQRWDSPFHGTKILGPLKSANQYPDCYFVNGIGSPNNFWKKREIIAQTGMPDERFETIIHPTASVSAMATLGLGTVVFQNAVITSNSKIGNHVVILPNTIVSHDDIVGDYTCVAGGVCISGRVNIGHSCYLGTNCSIIGDAVIGNNCLIGMASVVLGNVPENTVVVGAPARFLRKTIT